MLQPMRFTVTPALAGWLLLDGDRIADVLSSRYWAMNAANALAYRRHVDTGELTTVLLQQDDGSTVIADRHE